MIAIIRVRAPLAFASCAPRASAGAQAPAVRRPAGSSVSPQSLAPARSGDPGHAYRPVTASGAPRSYQVVSVPIPDALAGASNVEVEIVPARRFRGSWAPHIAPSPRPDASEWQSRSAFPRARWRAGSSPPSRFSRAGTATMVVPIEIDVTLIRHIVLRPGTASVNAQAGNEVILPFDIVNSGNAGENISAELTLADGWASRELHTNVIAIAPGETVKRRVRLKMPALSAPARRLSACSRRSGGG